MAKETISYINDKPIAAYQTAERIQFTDSALVRPGRISFHKPEANYLNTGE
jgi:hypothetical protein